MADVAMGDARARRADEASRSAVLARFRTVDAVFGALTLGAALFVLVLMAAVIGLLVAGSLPAFRTFGIGFLFDQTWNPNANGGEGRFGALAAIYGTVVTSTIAMAIAIPVGLGIAVFLSELCPFRLRQPIAMAIELLAGIPSIIYGIWGLFVFAPFMQAYVQPALIAVLGPIPLLGSLFEGPPYGIGVLTAGVILGFMVLPFISAISRDVFATVPPVLKEAGYGLGCTTWEVVRNVVLPYSRAGVIGGVMLALGRALGETMAVTFVIGNAHKISPSVLLPGTSISASIANEFNEATSDLYTSSLIALGLILFVISFIVLALARLSLARIQRRAGA